MKPTVQTVNRRVDGLEFRLDRVDAKLEEHTRILDQHTQILDDHSRKLDEHSRILGEHSRILGEHSRILGEHSRTLDQHTIMFQKLDAKIDRIHESVIRHIDLKVESLLSTFRTLTDEWRGQTSRIVRLEAVTDSHALRLENLEKKRPSRAPKKAPPAP